MAKSMYIMDKPECCLHCQRRSVIYAEGKGYQHCAFDTSGYKLETFFKAEDLKEGFVSSYCPLRDVPTKHEDGHTVKVAIENDCYDGFEYERAYCDGKDAGYNACIDEILGGWRVMKILTISCYNCVHCEQHRAYESCSLRTKNSIIYNDKREAENCNRYEQRKSEVAENE